MAPKVKFKRFSRQDIVRPAMAGLAFGIAGVLLLTVSRATTPTGSIEAENGTISGNAQKVSDAAASGGAAVKFGTSSGGSGPYLPYAADSFFKSLLTASTPVDSDSATGIAYIKANNPTAYPVITGVGGNPWGEVYFQGTCSDPIWTLTGTVPSAVSFLSTEGFHAPSNFGSTLTGTTDSPFVIMDTCGVATMPKGLTVWGAKASVVSGRLVTVGAAGAFQHDSNGLDKRATGSTSNLNYRSRGAIPDSMVIRKDRLDWAIANNTDLGYVLHMFWWETDSNAGFVFPMVGAESGQAGWGPEGIRIRIKPSVDLTKRGLSPAGLAIARTLQDHGAYIGDNAGAGGTALKAEQDYGQWGTELNQDALKGLTWDDFEFVQRGYQ